MSKIGKLWTDSVAYVALLVSASLSLAGNVADTIRVRGEATDRLDIWLAITWPGLVVLMVHVFVSARWIGLSWPMQILRWLGCLSVGAVAMRGSWLHLNDLMLSRGQAVDMATAGPLAIDFLAIMATALILAGRGQPPRLLDTPMAMTDQDMDVMVAKWVNPVQVANAQVAAAMSIPAPHLGEDSEAGLFARLEREMATADPTVPVSPAPIRTAVPSTPVPPPARQGRLSAESATEAQWLAKMGRDNGLSAGEISELLAGHYGVSSRTIRRCGWWVPTMAGKLESDAS